MTPRRTTILLLSAAALLAAIGLSPVSRPMAQQSPAIQEAPLIGWLELSPEIRPGGGDVHLVITGRVFSPSVSRGRYALEVSRKGAGGVSNSRQGGAFATEPAKIGTLSQSAINVQAEDRVEIVLKLFRGEEEVFRTTLQSRFPQHT